MTIKKALLLVVNNKTRGSVVSKEPIRKSVIASQDTKTSSAIVSKEPIRKSIIIPRRITSTVQEISRVITAIFEDIIRSSESFQRVVNFLRDVDEVFVTTEDVSFEVVKELSDSFESLQVINITVNKPLSETISFTSEGFLVSQNYTEDNSYFAQDYVGDSRFFN